MGRRLHVMRTYTSQVLLLMVLVALLSDILIRSRPVHAQTSANMYVDQISAQSSIHQRVKAGGPGIVAFSCAGEFCYILSK